MSFRDLKPEYRQKLQHILDEFARVAKENEKLRQDVVLLKYQKYQQQSKIAELRRENAYLLKIAGRRQSYDIISNPEKVTLPAEQNYPYIVQNASPNLLHDSPRLLNASTEELRRIQERLSELLPVQRSYYADSDTNCQPRYEHVNQRLEERIAQYQGQESDYHLANQQYNLYPRHYNAQREQILPAQRSAGLQPFNDAMAYKQRAITLKPSSTTEQISAQIRQTLPDLGYLQAKLGNCTQISLSDELSGASAPATRSVALQYSEVSRRPADVLATDTPGADFYCALQPPSQSENADGFYKTPFPLQARTFENDPASLETDFRRSRRPSQDSAAGKNGDFAENNITLSSAEPAALLDNLNAKEGQAEDAARPLADYFSRRYPAEQKRSSQENKVPLTQVREALPAEMASGRRSEILEYSRILMLNARKDFIKHKPQRPPTYAQEQLHISAARLAQSSRVQEEQQRQKIMKSLTSMQEDELDDLLDLLNSGVRY